MEIFLQRLPYFQVRALHHFNSFKTTSSLVVESASERE